MILLTGKKYEAREKKEAPVPLGTEEQYGDPENLSYFEETGGEYEALIMADTQNMVLTGNEIILLEGGMDDYGINSLDDYLLRYLNHYLGEGLYEATVREGTFVGDPNYPRFTVDVTLYRDSSLTYEIHCTYKTGSQRYSFRCEEIEE